MLNPAQQRDPAHLTADQSGLNDFSVVLCDHIPCSHKMSSSDKARSQLIVHCDVCVLHLFAGSPNQTADEARNTDRTTFGVFGGC